MPVRALRGATTVDDDTPEQIHERVKALLHELYERNALTNDQLISVVVTGTNDLRSLHPATAVRAFGLVDVPILGAQEMDVESNLPRCIRLLVHVDTERSREDVQHVFLEGARVLRPDLAGADE